jgi:hypothetical protein
VEKNKVGMLSLLFLACFDSCVSLRQGSRTVTLYLTVLSGADGDLYKVAQRWLPCHDRMIRIVHA